MIWFALLLSWAFASSDDLSAQRVRSLLQESESTLLSSEHKAQILQRAVDASEAILKRKEDAEALFIWIWAYGEWVQTQGSLTALRGLGRLESAALKLHSLDPDFENAAADRILGRLYHQAPGIISIGSNKKARKHFEEAMRRSPTYAGNQILYADFLDSQNETEKSRELAKNAAKKIEGASPAEKKLWVPIVERLVGSEQKTKIQN